MKSETPSKDKTILDLCNEEIFLITARDQNKDFGMIAAWIAKASMAKGFIRLTALLSPRNETTQAIIKSKRFVLHLLSQDQIDLVPNFGLHSSTDLNKFDGIKIARTETQEAIIPDTCGWIACKVTEAIDLTDRILVIAEGEEHSATSTKTTPLTSDYLFSHLPKDVVKELDEKWERDAKTDAEMLNSK